MNNSHQHTPPIQVGRGRVVKASYLKPGVSMYQGNPLIEALPPILTRDEVMLRLRQCPPYNEDERELSAHLRLHLVQRVVQFLEPLPVHFDLEQRFSRMIRGGYQARNPITLEYWRDVRRRAESLETGYSLEEMGVRSTAAGFTIIGTSGVGKTTAVEGILSLYPQVIIHNHYQGQDLTLMQIVWLKLDTPFDGSVKGLCLNFFQAVDDLCGTRYFNIYAGSRRTVDELLLNMARVASLHALGVLVIDEIQHLNEAKSGGGRKMLNFFVQLINTVGLPVVLIGTYKAKPILTGEFRQMRRGTGQGELDWDRMPENDVWQLFLEALWRYQYTQKKCLLTRELSHVLYEETQGIVDFAVKLYMLAQIRAITHGQEVVTAEIIRSTAADSFGTARKILRALREGDVEALHGVEDVCPVDVEPYLADAERIVAQEGHQVAQTPEDVDGHAAESGKDGNINMPVEKGRVVNKKSTRGKRSKRGQGLGEDSLPGIAASGVRRGVAAHESLREAGHIRSASEYFPGNVAG